MVRRKSRKRSKSRTIRVKGYIKKVGSKRIRVKGYTRKR